MSPVAFLKNILKRFFKLLFTPGGHIVIGMVKRDSPDEGWFIPKIYNLMRTHRSPYGGTLSIPTNATQSVSKAVAFGISFAILALVSVLMMAMWFDALGILPEVIPRTDVLLLGRGH